MFKFCRRSRPIGDSKNLDHPISIAAAANNNDDDDDDDDDDDFFYRQIREYILINI